LYFSNSANLKRKETVDLELPPKSSSGQLDNKSKHKKSLSNMMSQSFNFLEELLEHSKLPPSEIKEDSHSSAGKWSQHLDIGFYLAPAKEKAKREKLIDIGKQKTETKELTEIQSKIKEVKT